MINLCTLSDYNYLTYGLVLYRSITDTTKSDFTLHYLCLDNKCYEKLNKLKEENSWTNLKLYTIENLNLSTDWHYLIDNTQDRGIDHSDGQSTYHWALASFFTNWLMEQEDLPLLYADSDICFYNDVKHIFDIVGGSSTGLITHKHISPTDRSSVGYYNVGIIYFNNNSYGKQCLKRWVSCVIGKDTSYPHHRTCGDQKYLELFMDWIGRDKVYNLDMSIGHSAPWCAGHHIIGPDRQNPGYLAIDWPAFAFNEPNTIVSQLLYFYHFSHFNPDYKSNTWEKDREGEWCNFLSQPGLTKIYQDYFNKCLSIKQKYNI